jgi:hypothetical protein
VDCKSAWFAGIARNILAADFRFAIRAQEKFSELVTWHTAVNIHPNTASTLIAAMALQDLLRARPE